MKRLYSDVGSIDRVVTKTAAKTNELIKPVRESFFRRFPTSSLLLVTFGVSATVYGIERFIAEVVWLNDRPVLIITVGILVLVLTGQLYKKLG